MGYSDSDYLGDLLNFARVYEAGKITSASIATGVSVSALSRSISRLEKRLGATLLKRSTRAVGPTSIGVMVYEQALKVREAARQVETLCLQDDFLPKGILRISAPVSFGLTWLSSALLDFRIKFPKVDLQLQLSDINIDIMGDNFDLAIRVTKSPPENFVAKKLGDWQFWFVASEVYCLENPTLLSNDVTVLKDHTLLLLGQQSYGPKIDWRSPNGRGTFNAESRLECNNSVFLRDYCLRGSGVGLLPSFSVKEQVESGQLKRLMTDLTLISNYAESSVYLIFPRVKHKSAALQSMISFLENYARNGLR